MKDFKPRVSESIFDGQSIIIPMADVQHIEKHWFAADERKRGTHRGLIIVTKHTRWDMEADMWANNIYLTREEGDTFLRAWCTYRSELEAINERL